MSKLFLLGRAPNSQGNTQSSKPDWAQADPRDIDRALTRAISKPSGGWVVVDATRAIQNAPSKSTVHGRELVAWWCKKKGNEGSRVAPDYCPHMGAELSKGHVDAEGRIVCPWHALALSGETPRGAFVPLKTYDDGLLTWVRIPELVREGEPLTERPYLPLRPRQFVDGVIRMEAQCETRDVIANRLDPWHGAHFHPHSFANLRIIDRGDDYITVRVVYRIAFKLGMEVDARFDCPDPRTIVMTIISGEGVGSIVETHATPIRDGYTAITEATLGTTERAGVIAWLPKVAGKLIRPLVKERAKKLWVEDADYCERLYSLRKKADASRDQTKR